MLVDSPFRLLYSLLCRIFILLFTSQECWLLPVTEELLNERVFDDEVAPIRKS